MCKLHRSIYDKVGYDPFVFNKKTLKYMFDVASSTAAFTTFATSLSGGIGVVVTTTLAVAGALLIIGYAYRKFKQHATGRKW